MKKENGTHFVLGVKLRRGRLLKKKFELRGENESELRRAGVKTVFTINQKTLWFQENIEEGGLHAAGGSS